MNKLFKAAILGASVVALAAGAANAATYEITLAGASAQYTYWKEAGPDFLELDYPACTTVHKFNESKKGTHNFSDDLGIAYGTGCKVNGGTNDTVIFRYASIASYTGVQLPLAIEKDANCANMGEWRQIELTSCFDNGDPATGNWNNNCDAVTCASTNVGASDVAGEAFTQSSTGWKTGPKFTGAPETYTKNSSDIYVDTTAYPNLKNRRPIVVPFSLFVTSDIQNMPTVNTPSGTMKNLTQLQALLLMSGQVTNWEDVNIDANGDPATDTRVTVCYRHAGSGTHATMDHVLLHGDASMIYEAQNIGSAGPKIWFNKGSSDSMFCLSYDGGVDGSYPYSTEYAIGYSDSDKCGQGPDAARDALWSSKCEGVERIAYQGIDASRESIANCEYPYWAAQWIYYDTNVLDADDATGANGPNAGLNVLVTKLMDYASDPAKLTGSIRANFWATQDEMKCGKFADWTYPFKKN